MWILKTARSLDLYQQFFPFIRHYWCLGGSPESPGPRFLNYSFHALIILKPMCNTVEMVILTPLSTSIKMCYSHLFYKQRMSQQQNYFGGNSSDRIPLTEAYVSKDHVFSALLGSSSSSRKYKLQISVT